MPAYPYTTVPGSIRPFMESIRSVRVPDKADRDWLPLIGYKSPNHRTLLSVMKTIGFINQSNVPTDLWLAYRGPDHETVMADAVRNSYSTLFAVHNEPWNLGTTELMDFFNEKCKAAKGTIEKMVDTFKALCTLSDFTEVEETNPVWVETCGNPNPGKAAGRAINVNINIELPVTEDSEVYERILRAIRKVLLD